MKKVLRSVLFGAATVLFAVSPVLAIADPDSPPAVNAVYVYNDLLQDGDAGILISYGIEYAVLPAETATEAYLAAFIDTDGTTILRAVAPYTFVDSGYGNGYVWIYFTAAEVTTYSIDSVDSALYRVWLMGNPTVASGWAGDPPKTVGAIDYWQPADSNTALLFALRILSAADGLELDWALDLIGSTSVGNKLTATGEEYFTNAINDLHSMAPLAFASGEEAIDPEDINYYTEFGATMTNGTGTVTGSPITLSSGANTVDVTVAGTFTLELEVGTIGTVVNGTGAVTGSPVDLVPGTNTVVVPGGGTGTLTVTVSLDNLAEDLESQASGGILDLSGVGTMFGMSRWMFSGLIWLLASVVLCAAVYGVDASRETYSGGSGKVVMLAFDVMILIGVFLGLVHPVAGVLLFLGFSALVGYVFFFKPANI